MRRDEAPEREFYVRMAINKRWNVRELARQIEASSFERSVLGPPKLSAALREIHPEAADNFKDVYSLEFADLASGHSEPDLHGAILRNLGRFITQLGRDFCFVGSSANKRTTSRTRPSRSMSFSNASAAQFPISWRRSEPTSRNRTAARA